VVYPFAKGTSLDSLAIDPGDHMRLAAIISNTGKLRLIRSLDGGATWTTAIPPSAYSSQLVADSSGAGALVLTGFGSYISRDWGVTFSELSPPVPGTGVPSLSIRPIRDGSTWMSRRESWERYY